VDFAGGPVLAICDAERGVGGTWNRDDTIVFYYGDHGSGMPRSKRYLYNSGLNAAFIVYIPPKFKNLMPSDFIPGSKSDRLVAFVDLAPTLLSLIRPGQLDVRKFVTHRFELTEVLNAYETFAAANDTGAMKVVMYNRR